MLRAGAAAYAAEAARWEAMIEVVAGDPGLSRERRVAEVRALRLRQQAAAVAAQREAAEREWQNEKAYRRELRRLAGPAHRQGWGRARGEPRR